MVAFLAEQGLDGATVLEIGGGVGDIQLELLRRGAPGRPTWSWSTPTTPTPRRWPPTPGCPRRVTGRRLDIADTPDAVEPHDIVVLHRVVCCYPDYQRLLAAAPGTPNRLLVFSHPPAQPGQSQRVAAAENLFFRMRRSPFRTFVHDPTSLRGAAQQGRLRESYRHRGLAWHVVGLTTPPA